VSQLCQSIRLSTPFRDARQPSPHSIARRLPRGGRLVYTRARRRPIPHEKDPEVACAYNAGSVYRNPVPGNRWKMRQYPINSPHHADRFVKWFNDCFRLFERERVTPAASFSRALR